MPLTRLALTDFRNHADLVVMPGAGLNVLTGENGAGKTNILEAISMLAPGRGLRRARLSAMARQGGSGGFAIAARLDDADLGTGTQASAPERRIVRINGTGAAATALAEWLSVIWLTPAMDRLFTEGAGGRRRLLDRLTLALHPGHAVHATRYDAAMRARNRLLVGDTAPDPDWLSALEHQLGSHGAEIERARRATLAALAAAVATAPDDIFARADLTLVERSATDLPAALAASRPRDRAAGRMLLGPHRADLRVVHAAKQQPAELCSTGEQKALLLGLVLAHAQVVAAHMARAPLLLLDEVAAHLDPRRRAALFDRLCAIGGQVWMTGTEPQLFASAVQARHFALENGLLRQS